MRRLPAPSPILPPPAGQRGHFAYVLVCADGTLYTGYAVDVAKRLATHRAGKGAKYVRARLPAELLAYWSFDDRSAAMSAEARIKRLDRAGKLALVAAHAAQTSMAACPTGNHAVTQRSWGGSWV